jgi:hypothetical protein
VTNQCRLDGLSHLLVDQVNKGRLRRLLLVDRKAAILVNKADVPDSVVLDH